MPTRLDFIVSELWILSWGASVQRAQLFASETTGSQRQAFRNDIISFVQNEIVPNYEIAVSEEQHIANIQLLSDKGTIMGGDMLGPDGYKIGVAQKLLNLQLKYLWCLGSISEPPHCPVDRIMINETELKGQIAWTKIIDIDFYRQVIAALNRAAEPTGLSLARWELKIYNRMNAYDLGNGEEQTQDKENDTIKSELPDIKIDPPNLWGQQIPIKGVIPPSCNVLKAFKEYIDIGSFEELPPWKSQNLRDLQFQGFPQNLLLDLLKEPCGKAGRKLLHHYKEKIGGKSDLSRLPRPIIDVFLVGWTSLCGKNGPTQMADHLLNSGFGGTINASKAAVTVGKSTGQLFGLLDDFGGPNELFHEYFEIEKE
jgi:hypothetical protein